MGWFTDIGALGHAPFALILGPNNINSGIFGKAAGSHATPIAYGGGVLILANGTALEGIEAVRVKKVSGPSEGQPSIPANSSSAANFYLVESRPDEHTVYYWQISKSQSVDRLKSSNQEMSLSEPIGGKPTVKQVADSTFGQLVDWNHKMGFQGSNQSDTITFNDLGAFIHGWRGSDKLTGGSGNDDFWEGSSANDQNIIDGKGGIDGVNYSFVWEQKTNDVGLIVNGGFDGGQQGDTLTNVEHLTATEQDDSILVPTGNAPDQNVDTHTSGDAGNDKIRGNSQRNVIFGGAGSDTLHGGDGNDVIFGNIQFQTAGGEYDEIDGGTGDDWLYADLEGRASIDGGEDDDTIFGGDGNDTLRGGAGKDLVQGYSETSTPNATGDTLDGGGDNDELIGADGGDLMDGGADADDLKGNGGKDTLTGGTGGDLLKGGSDDDRLEGGAGIDMLVGGAGADYLDGGGDSDVAVYTGADTIKLALPGSANSSSGHALGDELIDIEVIVASDGDDDIDLGNSKIVVYGAGGADIIVGSSQNDTVYGDFGEGLDLWTTLLSARGIAAGGDSGNDELYGGGGKDSLYGGGGDDSLDGGTNDDAADLLTGGAGTDHYIVEHADTIASVEANETIFLPAVTVGTYAAIFYDGKRTFFYLEEGANSPLQVAILEKGISATRFSGSLESDGLHAKVKEAPSSNSAPFATSSLDPARSLNDFRTSWGAYAAPPLEAALLDIAKYGQKLSKKAIAAFAADMIGKDAAAKDKLKIFAEKFNLPIKFATFYVEGAKIYSELLSGELVGNLEIARRWGLAINKAFNPLEATTELGVTLVASAMQYFIDAAIESFTAPLKQLAGLLSAGTRGDDNFEGGGEPDFVELGNGNDTGRGNGGDDMFVGGSGKGNDLYDGGSGSDTLVYLSTTKGVTVDLQKGYGKGKEIDTDKLIALENVIGGSGNDHIGGSARANLLQGRSGNDTVLGGSGRDTLAGGAGQDSLTGGEKADMFVFDTKPSAKNVDTITDFKHNTDVIALDDAIFTAIGVSLDKTEFYAKAGATKAHDRSDRIVYDSKSGKLYYDDDGNTPGGHAPIHFATLANKPALDHGDFVIV